jgi:TolB-like protein
LVTALSGLVAVLVVVLAVPTASAQQATLEKAKEKYQFADYEEAVQLFSEVAQNESASKDLRRTALRYLGRAYVAQDKRGEAKEAIKNLITLEPPIVQLDPDVEPPPIMDIYYRVRKELEGGYKVQQQGPGMQTLAVMDFTNNSIDERERWDGLRKGMPSMMINYLNGGTDLQVIERERIQWILDELKLQKKADVVDQSTAVRTGKLLGANAVVFGSYIVHDEEMMIQARVVKVETGEVLLGEQVSGQPDEFASLIQDLSNEVTRAINVELEETKTGMSDTKSLDAMMAYSDGLALLEDGKYRAAYEKFLQATEYDSDFKKAKLKAQSLKPMLATADVKGQTDGSTTNR